MKIQDLPAHVQYGSPSQKTKPSSDKPFDRIFNQTLEEATQTETSPSRTAPKGVGDVPPVFNRPIMEPSLVEKASQALDHLEAYSKALKNPHMTLKGLEPLVARMERDTETLGEAIGEKSGESSELSRIANEIAVTARIEVIKFQRGDYIP